jgi:hypothetical protein
VTGKPEVMSWSLRLVPINALGLTDLANFRVVGDTEVIKEIVWSMLNQELSIVGTCICSRAKSLEWLKNPASFRAFSSLSFFVFEAS